MSNKKIISVLGLKVFQGFSAFVTIAIVSIYFSPEETGIFYTFLSLIALQIMVELGMASVLVQASAHEQKYLVWIGYEIQASSGLEKYASLIVFSMKWYLIVASIAFVLISTIGILFFQSTIAPERLNYIWLSSVFLFSITLIFIPIFSLLEGAGFISESAQAKLGQEITAYTMLWLGIISGLGLFAFPLLFLGRSIFAFSWMLSGWRKHLVISFLTMSRSINPYDWFNHLFHFQWKMAVSWISGYLVFQAIVPITFAMQGPILAGQLGVTLTAINGLSSIAIVWVMVNAPKFGQYISDGRFVELGKLFSSSIRYGGWVISLLVIVFFVMMMLLGQFSIQLRERFLDDVSLLLFLLSTIFNFYIFSFAIYLRAHKTEPLVFNSIISGLSILLVVYVGGHFNNMVFTASGYLLVTFFIGFLWTFVIYMKYKKTYLAYQIKSDRE